MLSADVTLSASNIFKISKNTKKRAFQIQKQVKR